MASIHRRVGSPYWIAAFDVPLPDGSVRRVKKSTKRKSRTEAQKEALRMEDAARKQAGCNDDEKGQKAYGILQEAAEAAAKGELSEGKAREILVRLTEVSTGDPIRLYTVSAWLREWVKSKVPLVSEDTGERYKRSIELLLAHLGSKANGRLEGITKTDIRGFRDSLKSSGLTARTTNSRMGHVIAAFRAAVREGLLLASPAAGIEQLALKDSVMRKPFTLAEVSSLVASAPDVEWQGMIFLGFYAGLRIGDAASLKWENVDLDKERISFMPMKTRRKGKMLEIPIHPRLKVVFQELEREGKESHYVFPVLSRRPIPRLSGDFSRIMESAGVSRGRSTPGATGKRRAYERSFHSLRHTLTSNLANADVPEEIRRRIVGHDSPEVHAIYTHTEAATLARAVEKLPALP